MHTKKLAIMAAALGLSGISAHAVITVTPGGGFGGNSTETGTIDFVAASDSLLIAAVITRSNGGSTGVTIGGSTPMSPIGSVDSPGGRGTVYYFGLAQGAQAAASNVSFDLGSGNASAYFYQLSGADQTVGNILFGSDTGDINAELSLSLDAASPTNPFGTVDAGSFLASAALHGKDDEVTSLTFGGTDGGGAISFSNDEGPKAGVSDTYIGWGSASVGGAISAVTADFTFTGSNTGDNRGAALGSILVAPIPEPSTYTLLIGGLSLGFILVRRRMRNR